MQGPPVAAPVEIRVLGEVLDDIQEATLAVEAIMKNTPGLIAINNPISKEKVDLQVEINRDKAALLGIPLSTIDHSIRTALDRKSTRLNSSHVRISYAVFCLK